MNDLTTELANHVAGAIPGTFTFLRPWWLLGILLAVVLVLLTRRMYHRAGWGRTIDESFMRHLRITAADSTLSQHKQTPRRWILLPLILGFIALAGPSWQELPEAAAENRQAMIIVFDLSPSMLARDVKPDRLSIAKLKLIDLLRRRNDGDTALLVYAGSVHRVAPLTDDPKVIISLVDTLSPALMPVAGSQVEDAITEGRQLLHNAGLVQGDILLITDGISNEAASTIRQNHRDPTRLQALQTAQFRLSILGIGTDAGAPIPDQDGGLLSDESGNTIIARLQSAELENLATQLGGHYASLTVDSSDVDYLLSLPALPFRAKVDDSLQAFDSRHDAGYWLVLLLLPLTALLFRRQLIWMLVLFIVIPLDGNADEYSLWWKTPFQQGMHALDKGDLSRASELLTDARWQAIIRYKQGAYEDAAALMRDDTTSAGFYNLGNALAMSGQYESALEAYAQALALHSDVTSPQQEDIQFNHLLVERLLAELTEKEQQQSPPDRRGGDGDGDDNQNSDEDQQENESQEAASEGEQNQIGGDTGQGQTLNQQALQQQGMSAALDPREQISRDPATDATATDSQATDSSRATDEGQAATTTTTTFEKNDNTVLNPYSEQWLRELPQDPGGYLRRKFSYEFQVRQSQVPAGGRY